MGQDALSNVKKNNRLIAVVHCIVSLFYCHFLIEQYEHYTKRDNFQILMSISNFYKQNSSMGASCHALSMFIKLNDHKHSLDQTTKDPTTLLKIRPKRLNYQGRNDQKMAEMTLAEMTRPKRPVAKRPR